MTTSNQYYSLSNAASHLINIAAKRCRDLPRVNHQLVSYHCQQLLSVINNHYPYHSHPLNNCQTTIDWLGMHGTDNVPYSQLATMINLLPSSTIITHYELANHQKQNIS